MKRDKSHEGRSDKFSFGSVYLQEKKSVEEILQLIKSCRVVSSL